MIQIEILIPAYLKSFLQHCYGNDYKASYNDEFGAMILSILQKKTSYGNITPKNKKLVPYPIKMSMSFFEKQGCHIYETDRAIIAKTIDQWFRNQLFRYAVINEKFFKIPYKETITRFLKSFGISEDELNYSTIRKDFNRKKERIEMLLAQKNEIS